jgi:hypothetical protein
MRHDARPRPPAAGLETPDETGSLRPVCNNDGVPAKLNRAQRVTIVVAWGAILMIGGMYVASGWSIFGFAESVTVPSPVRGYAPLNAYPVFPSRFALTALDCLFVWLGLVLLWVNGAAMVLRDRRAAQPEATD